MALVQFCRLGCVGGDHSFTAERPSVLRLGGSMGTSVSFNGVERWSSYTYRCEKVSAALRGSSKLFKGSVCVEPSSQKKAWRPGALCVVNASDHLETITHFFTGEFIEADSTLQKLAERGKPADPVHTGPSEEEGTSQCVEDVRDCEKSSDGNRECDYWTREGWKGVKMSEKGKLPIESNGPPMVFLQPYLMSDNSEQQLKEKLRHLPVPEPHKKRPPGLPRSSLRRRLGVGFSRKSDCADILSENSRQFCL